MKKILLPVIALCAFTAPAFADEVYGTTPETAQPFPAGGWFVETLDGAPAEAWFTITNQQASPVLWGDAPTVAPDITEKQQIFVYLCNGGQQAFQMFEGDDGYVLLPAQEYLVKITPKAPGFFASMPGTPLPPSMEGRKYYPKDITAAQNLTQTQAPGSTVWYLYNAPYSSQLTATDAFTPVMDITTIEAIHIQCPGGTNTGNGMVGPYIKAGRNVIGVTISDAATDNISFNFGLNAMVTLNCSNNLLRGQSLALDAKNTYPDAYYTVDRFFKVPKDGSYTFTNHGAKGTILNVGKVKLTDPDNNPYAFECDWSDIKSATVGNEDAVITVSDLKEGEIVLVQSDAFGVIGEGTDNLPYLMVSEGSSALSSVEADGNTLALSVANGTLSVESVLLASGAEVAVYDMLARKVAGAVAPEGASNLDINLDVTPGVYVVVVYGKGNSESAKIVVK